MYTNYIDKLVNVICKDGKNIKGLFELNRDDTILVSGISIHQGDILNIRLLDDIEEKIYQYASYIQYERRLTNNTYNSYMNDLDKYHLFLKERNINEVTKITKEDILSYLELLNQNDIKTTSIARKLTAIKNFHGYLYQHEIISNDVSSSIERPKLRKSLPKVLTPDEVDRLLDIDIKTVFDYRDKAMLELMYATGLRVSELVSLTINDIDLDECVVRCVGKGKKERMIPIGEYVIDTMNAYLNERGVLYQMKRSNYLFLNNHGNGISRSAFFKMIKKRLSLCNIHVDASPHTLRHSFATHMLEHGGDLRVIQELLGHADISTTKIYKHISNSKVQSDYEKYHPRSKKGE